MKHHLFYLGEEFYNRSSTAIGVLYADDTKERWDWGVVSSVLRGGTVTFINEHKVIDEDIPCVSWTPKPRT